MGRYEDIEQLVTAADIADRLNMSPRSVFGWDSSPTSGFPEPATTVGRKTRLWLWPEIAAWARARGLDPGTTHNETPTPEDPTHLLMTAQDIANLRGWKDQRTAVTLYKSGYFPAPLRKIGNVYVWSTQTVLQWHNQHPRRSR